MWSRYLKQNPRATLGDQTAFAIGSVTGVLPAAYREKVGLAAVSGDPDRALAMYAAVARLSRQDPSAFKAAPVSLQRRVAMYRQLKDQAAYRGPANRHKLTRAIEDKVPHTHSAFGIFVKSLAEGFIETVKLPLTITAAADSTVRQAFAGYYEDARLIAADTSLTQDQKKTRLNALQQKMLRHVTRFGIVPGVGGAALGHYAHFAGAIKNHLKTGAPIQAQTRGAFESANDWADRGITAFLQLSPENRKSLAALATWLTPFAAIKAPAATTKIIRGAVKLREKAFITKNRIMSRRQIHKINENPNFRNTETADPRKENRKWLEAFKMRQQWSTRKIKPFYHLPHHPKRPMYTTVYTPPKIGPSPLVRLYVKAGQANGVWLMRRSDYEAVLRQSNPKEILRQMFALPSLPHYVADFVPASPVKMRVSIANGSKEWGPGGAIQYELFTFPTRKEDFRNQRKIRRRK